MPKSRMKENETVNFQSGHVQNNQRNITNSPYRIDLPASNNSNKARKPSKTAMAIARNITTAASSSMEIIGLFNTLSIIPFHYDDNDDDANNSDKIIIPSPKNAKGKSNQKVSWRNVPSQFEAYNKCNTTDNSHLIQVMEANKTTSVKYPDSENSIPSALASNIIKEEEKSCSNENEKANSNTTYNIQKIEVEYQPFVTVKTFENSIIKYNKSLNKFKSQNDFKDSLLFSITPEYKEDSNTNLSFNGYLPNPKVVLDIDIINNKQLIVKNYKGMLIGNNEKLIMNAAGLVNGLRKTRDGLSNFGYSQGKVMSILYDYYFIYRMVKLSMIIFLIVIIMTIVIVNQ